MHRLLPILLLLLLIVAMTYITPVKKAFVYSHPAITTFAYKIGLSDDATTSCCGDQDISKLSGEFDEAENYAIFDGEEIDYPKTSLAQLYNQAPNQNTAVLGTTTAAGEEKWIEVSLDDQKVRAWEGNRQVMEFPISSGKWGPTPKGTFSIGYKTKSQKMVGGSKALGTYYYLPNVPNNMFFGNAEVPWYKGYALHGAYWHNNFGHPMSHGCVNEPLANAAEIFAWAGPVVPEGQNWVKASPENPGTRVYIH